MVFTKDNEGVYDFLYIVSVLFAYGVLSLLLGQDSHGDVWNYHLYNGWSYLNNRLEWDLAPAGAHSFLNPYLDVLFYKCVSTTNGVVYTFFVGILQGLVVVPLLLIVRVFYSEKILAYVITTLCCFGSTFFIGCLGLSTHDNLITVLVLISFYLLLQYFKKNNFLFLSFSAFILGATIGLKLTASTYAVTFCGLVFLFSKGKIVRKFELFAFYSCVLLLGIGVTSGKWFYDLYSLYGNPLFPFYNNIFQSPFASLNGASTQAMDFFQQTGLEHIFYPFFFADHPERVASSANSSQYLIYQPVFVLIACWTALCMFYTRKTIDDRDRIILFFSIFLVLSYSVWQIFFGVYRYFLPTDILFPLLLFMFLEYSIKFRGVLSRGLTRLVVISLLVLSVGFQVLSGIPTWGRGDVTTPYFCGNIPGELRQADVLFLGTYPSAWLIPVIEPIGHVATVGGVFLDFASDEYKSKYYQFSSKENNYLLLDSHLVVNLKKIEEELAFYNLQVDWNVKKEFSVRLSSHLKTIVYYKLKEIK